jgi:hypothetical protein
MHTAIKDAIEKHILARKSKRTGCVTYRSEGVATLAEELGITWKAANELVRSWILETF